MHISSFDNVPGNDKKAVLLAISGNDKAAALSNYGIASFAVQLLLQTNYGMASFVVLQKSQTDTIQN